MNQTANLSDLRRPGAGTTNAPVATEQKTLAQLISDPKIKAQMALALPKHLTADRFVRIATTELRKNPLLAQCEQRSFMGAIMQCAQLGLEVGGALGQVYLLPFRNKKKGILECQVIIGYRGLITLARRSGEIVSISARAVREGDEFSYQYGLHEDLVHVPGDNPDGAITHFYAVARLKDGGVQFEVLTRAKVEWIRDNSQGRNNEVWRTHFEEMGRKTVIRRLSKYLPMAAEAAEAVNRDEDTDRGLPQNTADVLTGDYSVIDESAIMEGVDTSTGEILDPAGQEQAQEEEEALEQQAQQERQPLQQAAGATGGQASAGEPAPRQGAGRPARQRAAPASRATSVRSGARQAPAQQIQTDPLGDPNPDTYQHPLDEQSRMPLDDNNGQAGDDFDYSNIDME